MEKKLIEQMHKNFEDYRHEMDDVEFWFARELKELLEYSEWRNFENVISKAKIACENSKQNIDEHFVDVNKTSKMPNSGEKNINDMKLTRYACYLIAQNGDPRKEVIAFAQSYFAIQARKQEIIIQRIKDQERLIARKKLSETETRLSKNIYERGVNSFSFAKIRSKGDTALFGGNSTSQMKKKLNIKNGPLADKLPTITIKAKDFATEITNFNVEKEDMFGENPITNEHVKNNREVRGLLKKQGIVPEELPAEEDIKKLERKLNREDKKNISKNTTLKNLKK